MQLRTMVEAWGNVRTLRDYEEALWSQVLTNKIDNSEKAAVKQIMFITDTFIIERFTGSF